jgi:tRNA(Arg) A34 adenosine deaminase TadA
MWSRREFSSSLGALVCAQAGAAGAASTRSLELSATPLAEHERAMRLAIAAARDNQAWPFGAVIVRENGRETMASGVNSRSANPTFHGEIVALNDYVARHGNQGWEGLILYTTAEPCPMCMSALVWSGIGGVVYGTSIDSLEKYGINQIRISAAAVIGAAPFYHGALMGGVLELETDALFRNRKRA